MTKPTFLYASLDSLELDFQNPRFADLYNTINEEELIQYLLENEAVEEIVNSIVNVSYFHDDRPLWTIKQGDKYLVKDGNRRCAAVKALQAPSKYGLSLNTLEFDELPILVYGNEIDLQSRIIAEHTNSTFRAWERIAKALEVYKVYQQNKDYTELKNIDSKPEDLLKLASFYHKAKHIGGEDFKKLLRRGRGQTGGKTIIFERLFKYAQNNGYSFQGKPSYEVVITNEAVFSAYIVAITTYLNKYPNTSHIDIDREKEAFLNRLQPYYFVSTEVSNSEIRSEGMPLMPLLQEAYKQQVKNIIQSPVDITHIQDNAVIKKVPNPSSHIAPIQKKNSTKTKPVIKRKSFDSGIKVLINECFALDTDSHPNTKQVMARIMFEIVLKYIIFETEYNNKKLKDYSFFEKVIPQNNNIPFAQFKNKFAELIKDRSTKQAFCAFDINQLNPVIHNYKISAIPADVIAIYNNLINLLEFMLQDSDDLLKLLDLSMLK